MPRTDHYDKYGNLIGHSENYTKEEKAELDARLADIRAREAANIYAVVEEEERKAKKHPFAKPIIIALAFLPLVSAIVKITIGERLFTFKVLSLFPSLFCAIVFLVLFGWSVSRFDSARNASVFRQIIVLIIVGFLGGTIIGKEAFQMFLWIINSINNIVLLLLYRKFVSGW
jgi:VIT1/CCC1 family predicted Fe2+/Mn2+ transporter